MRYYMFNKPRGCITACRDARHKTVMDYIPSEEQEGLFPIGRLDKDTEGLLILTDDGKLCFFVAAPDSGVTKTYRFWAKGVLDEERIKRLEEGVSIYNDKSVITAPAKVEKLREGKLRDIAHLIDADEARLKFTRLGDVSVTEVKITITEGKKHQVKRMAKAVGMDIVYLERIAIGKVRLDEALGRGEYRPLTENELSSILDMNK